MANSFTFRTEYVKMDLIALKLSRFGLLKSRSRTDPDGPSG